METLVTPAREVPILAQADVAVVGAGLGGVCASVAAARAGARTVLVERNAFPGGVATAGLMCSVTNYLVTRTGQVVVGGLASEFLEGLVAEGGAMPDYARTGQPQIPNDPEATKRVLIGLLAEAGVTTLYGSLLSQALVDGEQVRAIVCEAKGGPFALTGAQFVDASGDLDLFRLAGARHERVGSFSTLLFRMANVDIGALVDWLEAHLESYDETADVGTSLQDTVRNWREYGVFHLPHYAGQRIPMVADAIASGDLPARFGHHAQDLWAMGMYACRAKPGTVLVNSCAFAGDDLDVRHKSECEAEGRLLVRVLADFLVARFPGFADAYLLDTATEIGSRRTGRLCGLHTLTADEYRSGQAFPDAIGRTTEIDHTSPDRRRYAQAGQIPLRCLVSERPVNVICGSGKSASTDPCGLLRGQVGCMVVGQGAGTAAALAAAEGIPVAQVDPERLRAHLAVAGVSLA
ncbi:MAG: FAD-dependent oxidoreductase [Armatimonadetes bacterium]|nr:FAD-dependent oxidoreductase [Armatimonadota bacterium]